MILDNTPIQKQYKQYLIKLSSDSDLINIIIEKENAIYESNFNLQSLHKHQLLASLTTQKIIEFIIELIDINKIEIKEENTNLKLILISALQNHSDVELNLKNKNIISNEIENRIEKLERFHCIKDKIELKSCNLKNITSIHCHNASITSVSTFPSGNIISTSGDKSIIIYDIYFNILQNIQNAHDH